MIHKLQKLQALQQQEYQVPISQMTWVETSTFHLHVLSSHFHPLLLQNIQSPNSRVILSSIQHLLARELCKRTKLATLNSYKGCKIVIWTDTENLLVWQREDFKINVDNGHLVRFWKQDSAKNFSAPSHSNLSHLTWEHVLFQLVKCCSWLMFE